MKKHPKTNPLLNNNNESSDEEEPRLPSRSTGITSTSVCRSDVDTLSVENDESQNRFLIFSQRDTRGLILGELNDRDFLVFGKVCKAFFVYMMLDPRFNVLKPSFRLKLDHPNFHYELIYRELMAKYQQAAMHKSAMFMGTNMRALDIRPWRNQAIQCFEALYNGVTSARMTHVSRTTCINGIIAIKKCLLHVMPRSALDFSGCLLSLETVENSDFTNPIVDALIVLLTHENLLDAPQKAAFHLCCQDMNTSFFADFSVLLESVQWYCQYLNTPQHARSHFFNQNTQIVHHREVQQTANWVRRLDNIRTMLFGTSLDGHGRMLVVGSILVLVNLWSLILTISDGRSPNDPPGMRTHRTIDLWVGLVSKLLFCIFAALLFIKQRSENRLRELENNPPAPDDGQNHFVALDIDTEQRAPEDPLPDEETDLLDDHQSSPRVKKNQ